MELNEYHLELLTEVREKLRARLLIENPIESDGSEYICVQVLRAIGRRHGVENAMLTTQIPHQGQLVFQEMTGAITKAIDHASSVGLYINRLNIKNDSIKSTFANLGPLARLAWLDRMLETKVIA